MSAAKNKSNKKFEFGDFQTPHALAERVCARLHADGLRPDTIIEPTCGLGAFVLAAARCFPAAASIKGLEVNADYLARLQTQLDTDEARGRIELLEADFFNVRWPEMLAAQRGTLLILGNPPWVTNAAVGAMGGGNVPEKSNFLQHTGFEAITGKANFDISEWMVMELLRALNGRRCDVALLVKTAVARKVLAHAERWQLPLQYASLRLIDAKAEFGASVSACLLTMRLGERGAARQHDYRLFDSLEASQGKRVGHRAGLTVGDLDAFESSAYLLGNSPRRWRSGIKHDAAAVMELQRQSSGWTNGFGEPVDIEDDLVYPLQKGSEVAGDKGWRGRGLIVTQRSVGEKTDWIESRLPRTWAYLAHHAAVLDGRTSSVYRKNPRFAVFGVGPYAFEPWRIAICGLYKSLRFRLIGPHEGRPVMFDDTVNYLSFADEHAARQALEALSSTAVQLLMKSLVFWDEKRPIKTGMLNLVDWSQLLVASGAALQAELDL